MNHERLSGLDALRGIAALCVVGLHANAVYSQTLPTWFTKGYLGVDFFLMLSGYLMARITEPRLAHGLTPASFIKARYLRFWKVVALSSLVGIPYLWWRTQHDPAWFAGAFAANMVFLPFPADNVLFPLNVPVWTILAELLANALHVTILWRLRTAWLGGLVLLAGLATIAAAIDYGSLDVGARPGNWTYAPPRILLAYGLGILLWRCGLSGRAPRLPAALVLMAMPLAMLASWYSGYRAWPFDLAFVVVLCPLVILGALHITTGNALTRLSADLSFPLFAVHVPALELAKHLGLAAPWGLVLAFVLAWVILWWTKPGAQRMEPLKH